MRLHNNKEEFAKLLNYLSEETSIREDVLEKDYYVSLLLAEIAQKQSETPMYFKGGTALYKIAEEMRRFSEDIDLTVQVKGLNGSQSKKRLEKASVKFESLNRLKGDEMEENRKGSITAVYNYETIYPVRMDTLQRFGKVKVETTSFTVSDPTKKYTISPLIYKLADEQVKTLLKERYECVPFEIEAISLKRMFADKVLAGEFYVNRKEYFDVAKHIYDIHFLLSFPEIQKMLESDESLITNFSYKRIEELSRIGSDLHSKPLNSLQIFDVIKSDVLKEDYNKMMYIYVFQDAFRIPFEEIQKSFALLQSRLCEISNKELAYIHSDDFKKKCEYYDVEYYNCTNEFLKNNHAEIYR